MNWTETEHTLAKALREEPAVWTEACLDPDDLIELIEEGGASADAAGRLGHIAGCAYCQYAYADMRRTLRVAAEARAWQEAGPTPNNMIEPVASPPQNTPEDPKAPRLLFGGFRWPWGGKNLFRQSHTGYAIAAVCAGILLFQFAMTRIRFNVLSRSLAMLTTERDQANEEVTRLAARSTEQSLAAEQAVTKQQRLADKSQGHLHTLRRENAQLQAALLAAKHTKPIVADATTKGAGPNTFAEWLESGREQVLRAYNNMHVKKSQLAAMLNAQVGTLRSGQKDSFHVLSPICEVVEDDRPVFTWSAYKDAVSYCVEIIEPTTRSGQPKRKVIMGTTRETSWTPTQPLPRDITLQWKVTAQTKDRREDATTPEAIQPALFFILNSTSTIKLHALLEFVGNSAVKRGILYDLNGLWGKAAREYESVQPGDSDHAIADSLYKDLLKKWKGKPLP